MLNLACKQPLPWLVPAGRG